jgi:hypothetical protein
MSLHATSGWNFRFMCIPLGVDVQLKAATLQNAQQKLPFSLNLFKTVDNFPLKTQDLLRRQPQPKIEVLDIFY